MVEDTGMLTPRTDPIGALRSSETPGGMSTDTALSLNRSVVVVSLEYLIRRSNSCSSRNQIAGTDVSR